MDSVATCKLEREDAAEAIDEAAPGFQLYWTPRYEEDWAMAEKEL